MEFLEDLVSSAAQLAEDYSGVAPFSDYDDGTVSLENASPRIFLTLNTSGTVTTLQAIAIVLAITALLGGLLLLAYFLFFQKDEEEGYSYGYTSGYSPMATYTVGSSSGTGYYRRSLGDVAPLVSIVAAIQEFEEKVAKEMPEESGQGAWLPHQCKQERICHMARVHPELFGGLVQSARDALTHEDNEHGALLGSYVEAVEVGQSGNIGCSETFGPVCQEVQRSSVNNDIAI